MESLYKELSAVLNSIEQKSISLGYEKSDASDVHDHIMDLKDRLIKEISDYKVNTISSLEESAELLVNMNA